MPTLSSRPVSCAAGKASIVKATRRPSPKNTSVPNGFTITLICSLHNPRAPQRSAEPVFEPLLSSHSSRVLADSWHSPSCSSNPSHTGGFSGLKIKNLPMPSRHRNPGRYLAKNILAYPEYMLFRRKFRQHIAVPAVRLPLKALPPNVRTQRLPVVFPLKS